MVQFDTPIMVPHVEADNATVLLLDRAAATPDLPIFALPFGDTWQDVTAAEFLAQVRSLAKGFIASGIKAGDRVGFICKTSYEWSLIDFAMWHAGAALVPIYDTSAPSQIQWIMEDSEAVALIVETHEIEKRYLEVKADLPYVHTVWTLEDGAIDTLSAAGVNVTDAELEKRRSSLTGSSIATLIYTSGSTGKPKGCELTHANFVDICRNAQAAVPEVVHPGSSTLLFITMAHTTDIHHRKFSSGLLSDNQRW